MEGGRGRGPASLRNASREGARLSLGVTEPSLDYS
jgi:hypothetical protein